MTPVRLTTTGARRVGRYRRWQGSWCSGCRTSEAVVESHSVPSGARLSGLWCRAPLCWRRYSATGLRLRENYSTPPLNGPAGDADVSAGRVRVGAGISSHRPHAASGQTSGPRSAMAPVTLAAAESSWSNLLGFRRGACRATSLFKRGACVIALRRNAREVRRVGPGQTDIAWRGVAVRRRDPLVNNLLLALRPTQ